MLLLYRHAYQIWQKTNFVFCMQIMNDIETDSFTREIQTTKTKSQTSEHEGNFAWADLGCLSVCLVRGVATQFFLIFVLPFKDETTPPRDLIRRRCLERKNLIHMLKEDTQVSLSNPPVPRLDRFSNGRLADYMTLIHHCGIEGNKSLAVMHAQI